MKHLSILYLFAIISFDSFCQNKLDQNQEPMDNIIKVAAAQVSPVYLNKQKTVEKACTIIAEAAQNGARLIVFPEAFIPGYPDWVWLIPNSKGAELNKLFVELVENAVSVPDYSTSIRNR